MEPERELRKPTPPKTTTPPVSTPEKSYQAQPTKTFLPIQKNYSQEVCVFMGVILVVFGLIGFVVDDMLGAHLSYTHNAIHVASGALALWFGFDSLKTAKIFSYTFGTIYGLLGVLGFALGKSGVATMGTIAEDRYLWKVLPTALELGTADHILHILFGATFLLAASLTFKRLQKI